MSKHLPWFRMYSDAVDNEKLRLLAYEDRWHYIAILCCKGQGILDEPGNLMRRKIAVKLGVQVRELEEIARRLSEVDLVDPETLQPTGWSDKQFISDCDPTAADRKRRERERKKKSSGLDASRVTSRVTITDVTRTDTDTETDTETDRDRDAGAKSTQEAQAPSPDDEPAQSADTSPTFDEFWSAYPLKKAKQKAEQAWAKLPPAKRGAAFADVPTRAVQDRQWLDGFIPHAATYLNGERWTDEIEKRGSRNEINRKPSSHPRTAAERGEAFGGECWGRIRAQHEAGSGLD